MSSVCPPGYIEKTDWFGLVSRCVRSSTRKASTRKEHRVRSVPKRATRRSSRPRSLRRGVCPPGMMERKGYKREYSNSVLRNGFTVRRSGKTFRAFPKRREMSVAAACVKDTRKRKAEPKAPAETKGKQAQGQGQLSKYGYSFQKHSHERHAALRKAIQVYGPLKVFRKLDSLYRIAQGAHKTAAPILKRDRNWVYLEHKSIKQYLTRE